MSKQLPPLNPLRVFETVARLGNLTKAAEELHVTQSAVSRQIGVLENYLCIKLFVREARGVALTKQGRDYYHEVGPAFAQIATATAQLRGSERSRPLRIRAYTTFAAKWLLRHMQYFEEKHPQIEVRLSSSVEPVVFEKDDVDMAIQFGDGKRADATCIHLFHDVIEPVCSPSLLQSDPPLDHPADLRHHKLLHSRYRTADWPDWLRAQGLDELAGLQGPSLPSSLLAYQAAIEGLGVAMGQTRLLAADLESGTLVRPFNLPVTRDLGYFAVLPNNRRLPQTEIFLDWLQSEVRLLDYA
ncbi:transcriptional regulator GcvA [Pseudomonas lopnurensis]|uniref:transcriptional regulator GcvA n=1 Tax=Pseudomonas lopnurensis TaxID=1477517 RepID=UPI0028B22A11|nr:transcriptional regulator GcvA [Pseudomonas lopnurensis]